MTSLKFWFYWFKLGRAYWKSRHIWTLMAYLETVARTNPPLSPGDEMAAWLAAQEEDTE